MSGDEPLGDSHNYWRSPEQSLTTSGKRFHTYIDGTSSTILYYRVKRGHIVINPRRACAARVTVVGFVCVSVCLCVCLSVKSHLTYGASVRPENAVTYSRGNEGQKICGDLLETTAFKSYAAKHERKSQYAKYFDLPDVSFLRLTHSEGP